MMVCLLFLVFNVVISLFTFAYSDDYPSCGDCWCIPSLNGTAPCPIWKPQTEFDPIIIQSYLKQSPLNRYSLNCNPYKNDTCKTTPEQEMIDSDEAVCAFIYNKAHDSEGFCQLYSLKTFRNRFEAEVTGAVVTHKGACGLCSTTQDLALYLTEDFTAAGKKCATRGVTNETDGLECYKDLGLTEECAKIWNYDGIYDSEVCLTACLGHIQSDNNGPPPTCDLNPCLQCDEDKAGPLFSAFAGRTRRRSGLQSEIIRPCDSIARIFHHIPCQS